MSAGLVSPERGARGEHQFTFVDLVVLRTARDLLVAGVPFLRVRRSLERLRDNLPADHSITELRIGANRNRVVVREEDALWDAESRQVLIDFEICDLADTLAPLVGPGLPVALLAPALDARDWFELASELEVTSSEEASAAYRRALEADPGHVDAHVNLGRLMHEAGDVANAETQYRRALELRSTDLTARFNLGVALEDMNRLPEARNAYREAVLADPEHADAHFNLAGIYERLGQRPQAIKHLKIYRQLVSRGWESDGATH